MYGCLETYLLSAKIIGPRRINLRRIAQLMKEKMVRQAAEDKSHPQMSMFDYNKDTFDHLI